MKGVLDIVPNKNLVLPVPTDRLFFLGADNAILKKAFEREGPNLFKKICVMLDAENLTKTFPLRNPLIANILYNMGIPYESQGKLQPHRTNNVKRKSATYQIHLQNMLRIALLCEPKLCELLSAAGIQLLTLTVNPQKHALRSPAATNKCFQ
jgi:hypothetical protein